MTSSAVTAPAGAQTHVSQANSRRSFDSLDQDGDGRLSFDEFLAAGQDLPSGNDVPAGAPGATGTTPTSTDGSAGDTATGADTPDFMAELNANLMQMQEMYAALDSAIAGINAYMNNPTAGSPPDDFFNYRPSQTA